MAVEPMMRVTIASPPVDDFVCVTIKQLRAPRWRSPARNRFSKSSYRIKISTLANGEDVHDAAMKRHANRGSRWLKAQLTSNSYGFVSADNPEIEVPEVRNV